MKKNVSSDISEKTEGKGVFYQTGEIIGSIGFHIVAGKDKVIGAIKNKLGKKQPIESKAKKDSKRKSGAKAGRKITGRVKKLAKKTSPSKAARKKVDKKKKLSKPPEKKDDISTE